MMKNVLVSLDKLDMAYNPTSQVKKVWVRKDEIIHPLRGGGGVVDSPSKGEVTPCLRFWFLNPSASQVCLHCIVYHVISFSCLAFCLRNHIFYIPIFCLVCFEKNFCRYLMG
jgi:hypothetical protein